MVLGGEAAFGVVVKERRRVGRRRDFERSVRWWKILTWLWGYISMGRGRGRGRGRGQRLVYCREALKRKGEHDFGLKSMMPVEH